MGWLLLIGILIFLYVAIKIAWGVFALAFKIAIWIILFVCAIVFLIGVA